MSKSSKKKLEFHGGLAAAFIPVVIFLFFCILYFVIFQAFEMYALAMGAFIGLLVGALFARNGGYDTFWEAVYDGAREAIPVGVLLLIIGMFSAMIKATNISTGFVWLAEKTGVSGGLFTAFTFLSICIIATATGSSLGTMFTCFPIFFPSGVLMGSNPAFLAAAITCGSIFGDNLAPISDTTIISAGTQEYSKKAGMADVGGCVASRLKYSLAAGIPTFLIFMLAGGGGQKGTGAQEILMQSMNPRPLIMLIPVAMMLAVAIATRNIYKAITVGLILGTIIGLITGLLTPSQVLSIQDGAPAGYLTDGISGMMSTVILVISVYGIMGVLSAAGVLDKISEAILSSNLGKTARGTEIAMMLGISVTTLIFGGVTSASMATFGKIQNEIGRRAGLHPYRRANLLDGFANAIVLAVPFLSVFVLIGSMLTSGYDFSAPVSLTAVGGHMVYCYLLFAVLLISVITGWGRRYEGPDGEPVKEKDA